jgi:hypothetical protein
MALPGGFVPDTVPASTSGGLAGGFIADQPEKQYSPIQTIGMNTLNLFGLEPAAVGAYQSLINNKDYATERDAQRQAIETANEQNPWSSYAGKALSLVPETLIGGAVGKVVGAGAKAIGFGAKAAEAANVASKARQLETGEAIGERLVKAGGGMTLEDTARIRALNPAPVSIGSHIAKGALGGAGYGAASGAGNALSEGKDILPAAAEGAGAGAVLGGVLGGVGGKLEDVFSKSVSKHDKDLIQGIGHGSEEQGASTPTARKRLSNYQENVLEALHDKDLKFTQEGPGFKAGDQIGPKLIQYHSAPAEKALPVYAKAMNEIGEKLDKHWNTITKDSGGFNVSELASHIDDVIKNDYNKPGVQVYVNGLKNIKEDVLNNWAPELKATEATRASLRAQGAAEKSIDAAVPLPEVKVPEKELREFVTNLQTKASTVLNGLNPGEASEAKAEFAHIIKDFLDKHVEGATNTPELDHAIESIKNLNRQYNGVATAFKNIEQRGWKEASGSTSGKSLLQQAVGHGTLGAAGMAAFSGHLPAAVGAYALHQAANYAPAIRRAGTSRLAQLNIDAKLGKPGAIKLMKRIQQGQSAGLAGSGAVGSAVTNKMGNE